MTFVLIKLSYHAGLADSGLSYNVLIMSKNQMHRADSSNRSYKRCSLMFKILFLFSCGSQVLRLIFP